MKRTTLIAIGCFFIGAAAVLMLDQLTLADIAAHVQIEEPSCLQDRYHIVEVVPEHKLADRMDRVAIMCGEVIDIERHDGNDWLLVYELPLPG